MSWADTSWYLHAHPPNTSFLESTESRLSRRAGFPEVRPRLRHPFIVNNTLFHPPTCSQFTMAGRPLHQSLPCLRLVKLHEQHFATRRLGSVSTTWGDASTMPTRIECCYGPDNQTTGQEKHCIGDRLCCVSSSPRLHPAAQNPIRIPIN